jgi:hypothetical protein
MFSQRRLWEYSVDPSLEEEDRRRQKEKGVANSTKVIAVTFFLRQVFPFELTHIILCDIMWYPPCPLFRTVLSSDDDVLTRPCRHTHTGCRLPLHFLCCQCSDRRESELLGSRGALGKVVDGSIAPSYQCSSNWSRRRMELTKTAPKACTDAQEEESAENHPPTFFQRPTGTVDHFAPFYEDYCEGCYKFFANETRLRVMMHSARRWW